MEDSKKTYRMVVIGVVGVMLILFVYLYLGPTLDNRTNEMVKMQDDFIKYGMNSYKSSIGGDYSSSLNQDVRPNKPFVSGDGKTYNNLDDYFDKTINGDTSSEINHKISLKEKVEQNVVELYKLAYNGEILKKYPDFLTGNIVVDEDSILFSLIEGDGKIQPLGLNYSIAGKIDNFNSDGTKFQSVFVGCSGQANKDGSLSGSMDCSNPGAYNLMYN